MKENRKSQLLRHISVVLCLLLCAGLFTFAPSALDAVDTTKDASLDVVYHSGDTVLPGANFKIYKVADMTADGGYTLTEDFSKYSFNLTSQDLAGWQEQAETLNSYVVRDTIPSFRNATTDSNGKVSFTGLKAGIYLVISDPLKIVVDQSTGDKIVYYSLPYVVRLPEVGENDAWVYHRETSPKVRNEPEQGGSTPVLKEFSVVKTWVGEPANFDKEKGRPVVRVQLYKDGAPYPDNTEKSQVLLNEENSWRHTWTELPGDAEEYVVKELEDTSFNPDGYRYVQTSKTEGTTTTITNTYQVTIVPDPEPEPEPEKRTLTVVKKWDDENNVDKSRPADIQVQLKDRGIAQGQPIVLNTGNNWTYTWSNLDAEGKWTVEEVSVPTNYEVSYAGDQTQKTITITNEYIRPKETPADKPPEDTTKKLPQTGLLWWPVPVLLCIGLVCFAVAFTGRKKKEEAESEEA